MLKFRPHHFLCALGFMGKGYSREFIANFNAIVEQLRTSSPEIEVVMNSDSICSACPSRNDGVCAAEHKVKMLDEAHAEALGLKSGETLSWGDAKRRLADRMSLELFERACAPCAWKTLGMCRDALRDLKG
ncbi:MAG: hypothetical protein A2428_00885 [Bdellovibrionales bacterium RIFOXYC1_FULL_54_43]|nr:MAG: hypothetical protein A2428_00885 [Bdellovibrionales bacterium RIFOXYC1_FULL_54_43]OFZ82841.1 MAG: hypothetical protein A2603_11610 [Bdellovibrionales bacterium RIFOXYD1_FULL_55_31]